MNLRSLLGLTLVFVSEVCKGEPLLHQNDSVRFPEIIDLFGSKVEKRVIGGVDTSERNYPWAVSIKGINPKTKSITFCGSTIIADQWLLSAAHCFWTTPKRKTYLLKPENWRIQAGSTVINLGSGDENRMPLNTADGTSLFEEMVNKLTWFMKSYRPKKIWNGRVEKILLHPKYSPNELEYDIALIKVRGRLPLRKSRVSLAKLPAGLTSNDWPPVGSLTTFVGWGCKKNNAGPSAKSQVVSLKVLPNEDCSELYNHGAGLNRDHEFCAGFYKSNVGICAGDSGSGLIYLYKRQPVVVGVASATHAQQPQSYPGLFTRVACFTDWILNTVDGNT